MTLHETHKEILRTLHEIQAKLETAEPEYVNELDEKFRAFVKEFELRMRGLELMIESLKHK